jgi:hypothetical protein
VVNVDVIGAAVTSHAPCRVRLILTQVTLTTLDPATLGALLAHEIAHMQLSHLEARQARAEAQKQTEKQVKTASGAAYKAASFISGVGGLVSKGIGTARKVLPPRWKCSVRPTCPMQATDAMAAKIMNERAAAP